MVSVGVTPQLCQCPVRLLLRPPNEGDFTVRNNSKWAGEYDSKTT